MFTLAKLFIDLEARDQKLDSRLSAIQKRLAGWSAATKTAIAGVATNAVVGGMRAVASAMFSGVTAAVELQDVMSATQAVMGDASGKIFEFADGVATQFGAAKEESIQAALSFSQIFKAAGKSTEEAAEMGKNLTQLGMDLKSFKGGAATNADAWAAIQGALQGNFQGNLDRYNTFLTMAAVNQEAVNMGLAKNAGAVGESAKKLATYSLIMKLTKDQQGDLARTSDQLGNSWTKFTGSLSNTATAIGKALLPAMTQITRTLGGWASGLSAAFEANKGFIATAIDAYESMWSTVATGFSGLAATVGGSWMQIFEYIDETTGVFSAAAAAFSAFFEFVVGVVDGIGFAWRNLPKLFEVTILNVQQLVLDGQAYLTAFATNAGRIGEWFGSNWVDLLGDAFNAVVTMFTNLGTNLKDLWSAVLEYFSTGRFEFNPTSLLEGYEAATAALPEMVSPEFTDMRDQIRGALDEIAVAEVERNSRLEASRAERRKIAEGPAGGGPEKAAEEAAGKVEKIKASTSEDYYMKLREASLGAKDNIPKQQLAEQKRTREASEKTAKILSKGVPATLG